MTNIWHNIPINTNDISVVVQGAIVPNLTAACLLSVREHLPGAEIILSTWIGMDVSNLSYDILLLNKDVGTVKYDFIYNNFNNCNRQLYSTQQGLIKVSKKYVLKIRTDTVLENNHFLKYWDKFPARERAFQYFNHRVLVSSVYSRTNSDASGAPLPFHPSDFWFFGKTEDIRDYFSLCPLLSKADMANYQFKYPNKLPYPSPTWRFAPEQFFCISWARKHCPYIKFDDWTDYEDANIKLSHQILFNNFIFLGYEQSGIFCPKHSWTFKNEDKIAGLITYDCFQNKYRELCDGQYIVSIPNLPKINKSEEFKLKIKKHFSLLIYSFSRIYFFIKQCLKWIRSPFSILCYTICLVLTKLGKMK